MEGLTAWFRSYRIVWLLSPVVWVLLALAGGLHARMTGLPALELIVTYQEWFAALLLLPILVTIGTTIRGPSRGRDKPYRPSLVSMGYVLALTVFSLDLLVRALFGLGWEPFFLG